MLFDRPTPISSLVFRWTGAFATLINLVVLFYRKGEVLFTRTFSVLIMVLLFTGMTISGFNVQPIMAGAQTIYIIGT
jgi:hypothetical protein